MLCREHGVDLERMRDNYPRVDYDNSISHRDLDWGRPYKENYPYLRKGFMQMAQQLDDAIALLEKSEKYDFFYMIRHPEENDRQTQAVVDSFRAVIDIESGHVPKFMEYFASLPDKNFTDMNGGHIPSELERYGEFHAEKVLREAYYLREDDSRRRVRFDGIDSRPPEAPLTHRRFFLKKSAWKKKVDYANEKIINGNDDDKYISQDEFDRNVRRIVDELKWFRTVYIELNPEKMMQLTLKKMYEYVRDETGVILGEWFYGNPVPFKENLSVYMDNIGSQKKYWRSHYNGISEWRDLLDDEKVREMKVQADVDNPAGFKVSQNDFIEAFIDSLQFNNLPKETSDAIVKALAWKGRGVAKLIESSKSQEKPSASRAWERFNAKNPEFGKNPHKLCRQYDMISFISTFGAMYETTAEAEKDVNDRNGLLPLLASFFGKDVRECPFDIEIDERNKKLTVSMRIVGESNEKHEGNVIDSAAWLCAVLVTALPEYAVAKKVNGIANGYYVSQALDKIRREYYGLKLCHPEYKFPDYVILDAKFIGKKTPVGKKVEQMDIVDFKRMLNDELGNLLHGKHDPVYQEDCCAATFLCNREYAHDFYENYESDFNYYHQKLGELSSGILLNGI